MTAPLLWDLFCRVVDNHGDIGVCWRLAADLAARGEAVRLWVDDASALTWMAPQGAERVELRPFDGAVGPAGDVVVEAFACDPPPEFVAAMAQAARTPLWLNLEYLSAEAASQRNHALPSPQLAGPARGLTKWFFYPGFVGGTGGLLREQGLLDAQRCFDAGAWRQAHGIELQPQERCVSLFCYDGAPVEALLHCLSDRPTLLLTTPGAATQALHRLAKPSTLRSIAMPWLTQTDYDRMLWSCDLNFVRGEDSFVRAMWAGSPFVWQIYPQQDGAHVAKLDAFLDLMLDGEAEAIAGNLRSLWRNWNALQSGPRVPPDPASWQAQAQRWRLRLLAQPDLATQLLEFVHERR